MSSPSINLSTEFHPQRPLSPKPLLLSKTFWKWGPSGVSMGWFHNWLPGLLLTVVILCHSGPLGVALIIRVLHSLSSFRLANCPHWRADSLKGLCSSPLPCSSCRRTGSPEAPYLNAQRVLISSVRFAFSLAHPQLHPQQQRQTDQHFLCTGW